MEENKMNIKQILSIIGVTLLNILIALSVLIPISVNIEINSNDNYKSISGDKYIVVDGVYEELSTWNEFTSIINENSSSENEDTAIQVYLESDTLTNWSGLWRKQKTNMLFLGIKDSIWELDMEQRTNVFDAIKTYINPKEKATRTIQFIAYEEGSTRTLQVMEIKSTADNSVDKDLEKLQDSTAFENKETKYYLIYSVAMVITFIVTLVILGFIGWLSWDFLNEVL